MIDEARVKPHESSAKQSLVEPAVTGKQRPRSAEIHPGPGFQVRRTFERPDPRKVEHLRDYGTPDVSDQLNRLYTLSPCIKNQVNDLKIAGPALTVLVYPGDNLMVHKALDLARPGDIVVVHSGSSTNGVIGDLVATKARHRGIAAFVIDGYIRDIEGIREVGIPVFARGITPFGPLHRGPGEINFPISCGGVVVNPGDVILGDENGVVVVRRTILDELLLRLEQHAAALKDYTRAVRRGEFSNDWVDRQLDAGGCVFVD